jgi:cobalt-zinc-cadmium efflux system protein
LFNAILLMPAMGAIGWEAVQRIGNTPPLNGKGISVVSTGSN